MDLELRCPATVRRLLSSLLTPMAVHVHFLCRDLLDMEALEMRILPMYA